MKEPWYFGGFAVFEMLYVVPAEIVCIKFAPKNVANEIEFLN